jgi:hypothetical protein
MLAYKIQMPGNYPEENIQHTEHDESLKSKNEKVLVCTTQEVLSCLLCNIQARGSQASHQVLRDILKEVQCNMVPRSMLRDWAVRTFPAATDYWMFRKTVSIWTYSETDYDVWPGLN